MTLFEQLQHAQHLWLELLAGTSPLKPEDIVDRALLLTLTEPTTAEKELAFAFAPRFGSHGESQEELRARINEPRVLAVTAKQQQLSQQTLRKHARRVHKGAAEKWWDKFVKPYQPYFTEAVDSIIIDTDRARRRLRRDIEEGLKDLVSVSRTIWNGHESKTEIFYICGGTEDILTYSLMLMLDSRLKLGDALRRCKICDRIFLAFPPPSGGPRPLYCDPDRIVAKRLKGSARTKRWRQKKAKTQRRKS